MSKIFTVRENETWASFHSVYEWEDVLGDSYNLEFCPIRFNLINRLWNKTFKQKTKFCIRGMEVNISFIMTVPMSCHYKNRNIIPVFLDVREQDIDRVIAVTSKLPFYFVTSLDAMNMINEKTGDNRCNFIPLSVSDKYYTKKVMAKDIDVIQFGRRNGQLHTWMLKYCQENDNVNYVFASDKGDLSYVSAKGEAMGRFPTRASFMQALGRAKVSLVSTPSADGGRFGRIDFITPRFYESAAVYCHLIGRYSDNQESNIVGVKEVCAMPKDYLGFKMAMDNALSTDNKILVQRYDNFLKNNVTSQRVGMINNVFGKFGYKM